MQYSWLERPCPRLNMDKYLWRTKSGYCYREVGGIAWGFGVYAPDEYFVL
jgi:hypothetical protein